MYETVRFSDFVDRFHDFDRANQFSYEGLRALFDYLEEYEEETGEQIELDVIALCCDYTEYRNLEEFQDEYGEEYQSIEDIQDKTTVLSCPSSDNPNAFIVQAF